MKKVLVIGFLMAFLPSIYASDDNDSQLTSTANTNTPNHELIGLVDRSTGFGVDDARRVFPMMPDGGIITTNTRAPNTVIVFRDIGDDGYGNKFPIYTHEPYTNSNSHLMTNSYIFFYKDSGGTNVLRITDGSTNYYDVAFGVGPLPTNGVPVLTYSEVSGMVGDNNFARISGIAHYVGNVATNTISFDAYDFSFNREPVVNLQLRGKFNRLMTISAEAYTNKVDYYIVDSNGPISDEVDVYWSAIGTIDEVSNKIDEDVNSEP